MQNAPQGIRIFALPFSVSPYPKAALKKMRQKKTENLILQHRFRSFNLNRITDSSSSVSYPVKTDGPEDECEGGF